MARTILEKQMAYVIASVEQLDRSNSHQRLSRHLGQSTYCKTAIIDALYPLLGNGRPIEKYRESFRGQITGVRQTLKGTAAWTNGGKAALGPLFGAPLDELEHQFKAIAEIL